MATKKLPRLNISRLEENTKLPVTEKIGYTIDLYAGASTKIMGHGVGKIPTGLSIKVPDDHYLQIFEENEFSLNNTLSIKVSHIKGFVNDLKIVFANTGPYPIQVEKGEKIATAALSPVTKVIIEEES